MVDLGRGHHTFKVWSGSFISQYFESQNVADVKKDVFLNSLNPDHVRDII